MPAEGENARWLARIARVERLLARRAVSRRTHNIVLAVAAAVFIVVSVVSFTSISDDVEFHWWPLPLLVLVTTPATLLANAAEFRVMGRINGHVIGSMDAVRLTVVATAANLLPLPGGILVRTGALRGRGSSYRHALSANAAAGVAWIGWACLVIACLYASHSETSRWAAAGLAVGGLVALAMVWVLLRAVAPRGTARLFWDLSAVEIATVLIVGARFYLAFRLIGLTASVPQAVALTASAVIASTIGIFPGGLGIREALAGVIATTVNLAAGEAIAATAADRLVAQLGLGLITGALVLGDRMRHGEAAVAPLTTHSAREQPDVSWGHLDD